MSRIAGRFTRVEPGAGHGSWCSGCCRTCRARTAGPSPNGSGRGPRTACSICWGGPSGTPTGSATMCVTTWWTTCTPHRGSGPQAPGVRPGRARRTHSLTTSSSSGLVPSLSALRSPAWADLMPWVQQMACTCCTPWATPSRSSQTLETTSPANAVIVGAAYVGLEMAEALTARGLRVTQIEQLPEVLATVDAASPVARRRRPSLGPAGPRRRQRKLSPHPVRSARRGNVSGSARAARGGHPSCARILKPCKITVKGAPAARRSAILRTLDRDSCQGFRGRLSDGRPGPAQGRDL